MMRTLLSFCIEPTVKAAIAEQNPDDAKDFAVRVFDDVGGVPYEVAFIYGQRGYVQSDHPLAAPHLWAFTTSGLKPFFQAEKIGADEYKARYASADGAVYQATIRLSLRAFGWYVYSVRCRKLSPAEE